VKLRQFLFQLHLYTGLLAGLLLSVTGVTGSLLVFSHEIDSLLYPTLFHARTPIKPASLDSPQSVLDLVTRVRPGVTIQSLVPPRDAGDTYELRLKGDRRLYVDPYTGQILGERRALAHPLGFVFSLHTKLLSGENGETAVGVGGVLLLLLGATGVVLWWPSKKGVRAGFTIRWGANWKRVNFDVHRVSGATMALLLCLVALTGAAMVWSEQVTGWAYQVAGIPAPRKPGSTVRKGASPLSLDELQAQAEAALPGGVFTRITLASKPAAPVMFRKKLPQELHPNGTSFVYLDQYTGKVLQVENALHARAPTRLLNLRYPLHIGQFGGWPMRVLYMLVGLTPLTLFTTGCLMWWNRVWVPKRRRSRPLEVSPGEIV